MDVEDVDKVDGSEGGEEEMDNVDVGCLVIEKWRHWTKHKPWVDTTLLWSESTATQMPSVRKEHDKYRTLGQVGHAVEPLKRFFKTIRISTMHILRMIIAKAEETQRLRINFVLCFSTLIFYNKLKLFCFHWKQGH